MDLSARTDHSYANYVCVLVCVCALALSSGLTVSGLLTTARTLTSSGTVRAVNVEVYWDDFCTQVVSSVDWGIPEPGELVNKSMYIKNSGTVPLDLSIITSSWTPPEAANYITLTWDREGASIDPDQVTLAQLTLTVSDKITGITDFTFNIIVEGSG